MADAVFEENVHLTELDDVGNFFKQVALDNETDIKKVELVISLFIGSINDIERVKLEVPQNLLDKVKQKIQLFDGDQTRFIYQKPPTKKITIQGLSGTGKTELLLHKLRDLYISDSESKICFTCHNKILADNLRKRIPSFFNFMKVEQQIEWNDRLWCVNAWGSGSYVHSGAYQYICAKYDIPFYPYSGAMPFSRACRIAIDDIKNKYRRNKIPFAFDYMLIDESQDFTDDFLELCELVTRANIYVAGDIFQSIFDRQISSTIRPDYLLGKCYRTDPKTLMFAHGLGMGLFEKTKLRWLEEKEWRDCGYNVTVDRSRRFHLSREPLRRFEDFDDNYESVEVVRTSGDLSDQVIKIVQTIRAENPTVIPDDIGIIFLDTSNYIYGMADLLEVKLGTRFKWKVNKAYQSKIKQNGTVFISNRYNVKGLEFPFVICITARINSSPGYRNGIYTMLTRSFLRSYLLMPDTSSTGFTEEMQKGLQEILTTKEMVIEEPSVEEKKSIRMRFEYEYQNKSVYDIMMIVFAKLKIPKEDQEKFLSAATEWEIEPDEELLTDFVNENKKYIHS